MADIEDPDRAYLKLDPTNGRGTTVNLDVKPSSAAEQATSSAIAGITGDTSPVVSVSGRSSATDADSFVQSVWGDSGATAAFWQSNTDPGATTWATADYDFALAATWSYVPVVAADLVADTFGPDFSLFRSSIASWESAHLKTWSSAESDPDLAWLDALLSSFLLT